MNFFVFLCFSVISCDLPGVAGHALCLQVSSVYQSINQWAPVTHHLLFCFSGLAMSLSAACRRLANVFLLFALLPGSIPLIHSTHMESNIEQSNLCQDSHLFHFSKPFIQSPGAWF